MNRKIMNKLSNFVLGNGFYIALTLCLGLIVFSGYYLMDSMTPDMVAPVSGVPEIVLPQEKAEVMTPEPSIPVEVPVVVAPTLSPENLELPTPVLGDLSKELEEESQDSPLDTATEESLMEGEEHLEHVLSDEAPLSVSYTWPAEGEVTQYHSLEVLSYHPIMGDWRTHAGIDISCDDGSAVFAMAAGEVSAVFQDPMMGTTVVIAHGDSLESTYANLGEFPSVSVGDWITGGQIIAVVGTSALSEQGNPPHLQFSVTKDGVPQDPLDFFPQGEVPADTDLDPEE